MDHLPKPSSAVSEADILVLYVCQEGYDGGEFLGYPTRIGLPPLQTVGIFPGALSYAHRKHLDSMPRVEIESFYQSWLFFGLIHEVLGNFYSPDEFISLINTDDCPTKVVSTTSLITKVDTWVEQIQKGVVEPILTYDHIAECLCLTHAALRNVRADFNSEIKISLLSLAQTLGYAASKAFNIAWEDSTHNNKLPLTWTLLSDDAYWAARLRASGWCVSQIKIFLETSNSLQTLHFLTRCNATEGEGRHGSCEDSQCIAYQNDPENYQTRHNVDNCNCEEISIDQEVLMQILEQGSLPLIHVNEHENLAELSVEIVASHPASRFVALSHVWADGLGNPKANALPRCQLSYLKLILERLNAQVNPQGDQERQRVLLWCDTLCCPTEPEKAKILALQQMYRTYEQAEHVLVLDQSLQMHRLEALDLDELCARVLFSPWMRRLWTLQEASCPAEKNRLWFQFKGNAINIRELRLNIRDAYFSSVGRRGLASDLLRQLAAFANIFRKSLDHPGADLGTVASGLQYRSVSVPSDEPLLIGALLGLDLDKVLDGPKNERMNRLWRTMPSALRGLPKDIIFQVGPRLTERGLRWAPATMLLRDNKNGRLQATEEEGNRAFVTEGDGLLAQFLGIHVSLAQRPKGFSSNTRTILQLANQNVMYIKGENGRWYLLRRRFSIEEDSFLTDQTLCATVQRGVHNWIIASTPTVQRLSYQTCLLVELESNNNGIKKARSKLHVAFGPCAPATQDWLNGMFGLSRKLANSTAALRFALLANGEVDMDSMAFKTAIDALNSMIQEIATSEDAEAITARAGNLTGQDGSTLIGEYIEQFFMGQYLCAEDETARCQQWCVD